MICVTFMTPSAGRRTVSLAVTTRAAVVAMGHEGRPERRPLVTGWGRAGRRTMVGACSFRRTTSRTGPVRRTTFGLATFRLAAFALFGVAFLAVVIAPCFGLALVTLRCRCKKGRQFAQQRIEASQFGVARGFRDRGLFAPCRTRNTEN